MKRPLLVGVGCYILGIIGGLYLLEISIAFVFVYFLFNKKLKWEKRFLIYIFIFIIGFINIIVLNVKWNKKIEYLENSNNTLSLIVKSEKTKTEYGNKYIVKLNGKNIRVFLYTAKDVNLNYNDEVILKGKISIPEEERNYKGFNYRNYLKSKNICASIQALNIVKIKRNTKFNIFKSINDLKNVVIENIISIIDSKDEAGIILGMLIGESDYLTKNVEANFTSASLTHILCVSGANMVYVITFSLFLFKKINKRFGYYFGIGLIFLFMLLTGMSASVVRAGIMGIIMLLSKIFYRKLDIFNSLGLSLIIILLNNPYAIWDIGLQFSFLATLRNRFNIS